MDKKINDLLKKWEEIYGSSSTYGHETLKNIAINCISLSETWFSKNEQNKKLSYELALFDKEGIIVETLHGITKEILPETMLKIIVNDSSLYSKMMLSSFYFNNGKKETEIIGELEIR